MIKLTFTVLLLAVVGGFVGMVGGSVVVIGIATLFVPALDAANVAALFVPVLGVVGAIGLPALVYWEYTTWRFPHD